jgi:hypothetical protein
MGVEIDAGAVFNLKLGDEDVRKLARESALQVVPVEFGGDVRGNQTTFTDPASSIAYIRLYAYPVCPEQSWWEVRALHVTKNGSPLVTSVSGETCYVFISQGQDDISSAAWRDSTALAIPQPAFYSAGQMVLYPGWQLHAAITSPDSTATYQVVGTALQRPYGDRPIPTIGV